MLPVEIKDSVYWVGAVDWNIRDFHGYSTYKGTTYNAYLIMDDKITLVDTVKNPFKDELINNISQIVDPGKIDYLIVNHVEMDHAGSVREVVDLVKPEKIFCSPMAQKTMLAYNLPADYPYEVVKTGQSLSLGKKTVQFLETRMLHWPDSMFSYLPEDKAAHFQRRFWGTSGPPANGLTIRWIWLNSWCMPRSTMPIFCCSIRPWYKSSWRECPKMELHIDMIAPDHGLIWRGNPAEIIEAV